LKADRLQKQLEELNQQQYEIEESESSDSDSSDSDSSDDGGNAAPAALVLKKVYKKKGKGKTKQPESKYKEYVDEKHDERLNKIESILERLAKSKKLSQVRPKKVEKKTIIQLQNPVRQTDVNTDNLKKQILLKL
jgi:hypothetical protein